MIDLARLLDKPPKSLAERALVSNINWPVANTFPRSFPFRQMARNDRNLMAVVDKLVDELPTDASRTAND